MTNLVHLLTLNNLVQFVGTALIFYGVWTVRSVRLRAPAALVVAETFMFTAGFLSHTWCLIAIGAVLTITNVRTFLAWKRDGRPW